MTAAQCPWEWTFTYTCRVTIRVGPNDAQTRAEARKAANERIRSGDIFSDEIDRIKMVHAIEMSREEPDCTGWEKDA